MPPQLKIAQPFATGTPLVAIKLLPMDPEDEAWVMLPAEHAQEHVVEFGDLYII